MNLEKKIDIKYIIIITIVCLASFAISEFMGYDNRDWEHYVIIFGIPALNAFICGRLASRESFKKVSVKNLTETLSDDFDQLDEAMSTAISKLNPPNNFSIDKLIILKVLMFSKDIKKLMGKGIFKTMEERQLINLYKEYLIEKYKK